VLGSAMGGGYVNYFSIAGRSYQGDSTGAADQSSQRLAGAGQHHAMPDGTAITAATVASLQTKVVPQVLSRFQQFNSATIAGVASVSQQEALEFLRTIRQGSRARWLLHRLCRTVAPVHATRSGGFAITLLFAVIIVLPGPGGAVQQPA
jgi:multidrug efflux pump